jgi:hypothetical protein
MGTKVEPVPITYDELKAELDRIQDQVNVLVERVRSSDEGLEPDELFLLGTVYGIVSAVGVAVADARGHVGWAAEI